MCYTIEINLTREQIENRFNAKFRNDSDFEPQHKVSAFTLPELPVICSDSTDEIKLFTWGLIPFWVRNEEDAKSIRTKTFNARAESIADKASYKNSFKSKRCLVLADGFYEWHTSGREKIPYFINLKDNSPFALAGLYDNWLNRETGEYINTFTVITTRANPMLEKIHNLKKRMPVILPPDIEDKWLDINLPPADLKAMLEPFNEKLMSAGRIEKSLFFNNNF
jgi:putative SOS response-associated peptidase YedK